MSAAAVCASGVRPGKAGSGASGPGKGGGNDDGQVHMLLLCVVFAFAMCAPARPPQLRIGVCKVCPPCAMLTGNLSRGMFRTNRVLSCAPTISMRGWPRTILTRACHRLARCPLSLSTMLLVHFYSRMCCHKRAAHPRRFAPLTQRRAQGRYGVDDEGGTKDVCSSSADSTGFSEEPSVSRSRSASQDAPRGSSAHSSESDERQSISNCAVRQQGSVRVHQDGGGLEMSCDDSAMIESDDGEYGDMEEEDDEDEDEEGDFELEEEEEEEEEEVLAQRDVIGPSFDEAKCEATTRSSEAHEARVLRIIDQCFPGMGMISFERMYRASRSVKCITRESLLQRDHMLLPAAVATKVD